MTLYDRIKAGVDGMIVAYKEAYADQQLTFSEVIALVMLFIRQLIDVVAQVTGYDSAERKAAILVAVEQFVDEVITPIDLKPVPNWLEGIVDRGVKTVVMQVADGAIDALINILDKIGDFGPAPDPVIPPPIEDGQILAMCTMPSNSDSGSCGGGCCGVN